MQISAGSRAMYKVCVKKIEKISNDAPQNHSPVLRAAPLQPSPWPSPILWTRRCRYPCFSLCSQVRRGIVLCSRSSTDRFYCGKVLPMFGSRLVVLEPSLICPCCTELGTYLWCLPQRAIFSPLSPPFSGHTFDVVVVTLLFTVKRLCGARTLI